MKFEKGSTKDSIWAYLSLSKNKGLECSLKKEEEASCLFHLWFVCSLKGQTDHHGVTLYLTLYKWSIDLNLYDKRHVECVKGECEHEECKGQEESPT